MVRQEDEGNESLKIGGLAGSHSAQMSLKKCSEGKCTFRSSRGATTTRSMACTAHTKGSVEVKSICQAGTMEKTTSECTIARKRN